MNNRLLMNWYLITIGMLIVRYESIVSLCQTRSFS